MMKPKLIVATLRKKGGDIKTLLLPDGFAISISGAAIENVGMSITEGVVDLGQDGNHLSCFVLTKPETHWFEYIAQHSGKATQPNLSIGLGDSRSRELFPRPFE